MSSAFPPQTFGQSMVTTSWPLVLLLPCVTAFFAQPCTRTTLRHASRATARCELNEIGETSQTTRSLVSSLTAVVNAMSGSAPPPAPRERAQAALDGAAMLAGLRADFEEHEYLWSGKITAELYDEDCVFTDPTLSFEGLATFERNLVNLDPWIERFVPPGARSCELKKIELLDARGMFKAPPWWCHSLPPQPPGMQGCSSGRSNPQVLAAVTGLSPHPGGVPQPLRPQWHRRSLCALQHPGRGRHRGRVAHGG